MNPHVITTITELEQLHPHTVIMDKDQHIYPVSDTYDSNGMIYPGATEWLPIVIVNATTDEHINNARKALNEHTRKTTP